MTSQRMGKSWYKEMRVYTKAGKDKNYKDKYTHVTLVEEDDKPEDGEEVELRRCESSQKQARTRTTRKGEEKQSLLGSWSMGRRGREGKPAARMEHQEHREVRAG